MDFKSFFSIIKVISECVEITSIKLILLTAIFDI